MEKYLNNLFQEAVYFHGIVLSEIMNDFNYFYR